MPLAETVVCPRADDKATKHSAGVENRFHQLPHVVSVRAGDATVLMDRKRGRYFTLNEVAGQVWDLVGAGATVPEIVERLIEQYDVRQDELEGDVETTVRQLASGRLIAPGPRSTRVLDKQQPSQGSRVLLSSGEFRVPSVLKCGLMIFVVRVMLKTVGFAETSNWVRNRVDGLAVRKDVPLDEAKATEQVVAMAGALYPGRAKCLEQSLTLYWILRSRGIDVRFRMGVQPFPFLAHAWVDHRDQPLNDVAEHITWFTPLPDMLP